MPKCDDFIDLDMALSSTVAQVGSETVGDVCTRPGSSYAVGPQHRAALV